MLLGRNFPCNNFATWRDGTITVGGAGGSTIDGQFVMTGDAITARNEMVMLSCQHWLPVEVAIEEDADKYLYIGMRPVEVHDGVLIFSIGTWFVKRAILEAHTPLSSGKPFFIFELVNRRRFLLNCNSLHPLSGNISN